MAKKHAFLRGDIFCGYPVGKNGSNLIIEKGLIYYYKSRGLVLGIVLILVQFYQSRVM